MHDSDCDFTEAQYTPDCPGKERIKKVGWNSFSDLSLKLMSETLKYNNHSEEQLQ